MNPSIEIEALKENEKEIVDSLVSADLFEFVWGSGRNGISSS